MNHIQRGFLWRIHLFLAHAFSRLPWIQCGPVCDGIGVSWSPCTIWNKAPRCVLCDMGYVQGDDQKHITLITKRRKSHWFACKDSFGCCESCVISRRGAPHVYMSREMFFFFHGHVGDTQTFSSHDYSHRAQKSATRRCVCAFDVPMRTTCSHFPQILTNLRGSQASGARAA